MSLLLCYLALCWLVIGEEKRILDYVCPVGDIFNYLSHNVAALRYNDTKTSTQKSRLADVFTACCLIFGVLVHECKTEEHLRDRYLV